MLNFKDTLKLAKANNIETGRLMTADEVACVFGEKHPRYEQICNVIYDMYLDTDGITINDLTNSFRELLDCKQVTMADVLEYGEGYEQVKENACYIHC